MWIETVKFPIACTCRNHIRSPHPPTLPPSFPKWCWGQYVQKQWEHVRKRASWGALPEWSWTQQITSLALLNTTSSLNSLFLELGFSTWWVTFNFTFLKGHIETIATESPSCFQDLTHVRTKGKPRSTLPTLLPHMETQLNLGSLWRAPYLKVSLSKVCIPQDSKECEHNESSSGA